MRASTVSGTSCPASWSWLITRVNEHTLWKIRQLATRWLYLISLRCWSRSFSAIRPSPPKNSHWTKPVERLALVGRGLDDATKLGVVEVPQEKGGPHDAAQFLEGLVEAVLPAVGPEPAQQRRGRDPTRPDRQDHPQHVGQVRLDERPIDHVREQRVDVLVA